jgi:DNA processing protein
LSDLAPTHPPSLSARQRLDWLRLIRTEGVGPATFRDLVNRFGSAEAAIDGLPRLMRRAGLRVPRVPSEAEAQIEMEKAEASGARFIALGEPDYPPLLRAIDYPPPLLAVRGQSRSCGEAPVAIVGARNASLAGIRMARRLAVEIGNAGHAIVSGLARGIDRAAHEGALETGTVAVFAGGLDRPYPAENAELAEAIVAHGGALVSEMPFGWEPRARDFPRRNRIVAGMAHGLVVVEAAHRSGSLISARIANEFGRLVFAVPGSPLDPRAAGANQLLKDGATLVTDSGDVIEALKPLLGRHVSETAPFGEPTDPEVVPWPDEPEHDRVVEALGPVPVAIDEIVAHTGLHTAQVLTVVLELDLAGRIERHAGGRVSLV